MRSFIAIELPESIHKALAVVQSEYKETGADIRLVKPDNIHLTLKFLGDIPEAEVEKVEEVLKTVCGRYEPFEIGVCRTGIFPPKGSPRVLWAGLRNNNHLTDLQRDIEDGLADIGFKKENRRFIPHLTIGRFRSSRRKEAVDEIIRSHENDGFGEMTARSVCLMKSELRPEGARYSKISETYLKSRSEDN